MSGVDARQDGDEQTGQDEHDQARIGTEQGEQEAQTQGAEADDGQLLSTFGRVHVPLQTVDLLHIGQAQSRAKEQEEG